MQEVSLNTLLRIVLLSPSDDAFDPSPAVQLWWEDCKRREGRPPVVPSDHGPQGDEAPGPQGSDSEADAPQGNDSGDEAPQGDEPEAVPEEQSIEEIETETV